MNLIGQVKFITIEAIPCVLYPLLSVKYAAFHIFNFRVNVTDKEGVIVALPNVNIGQDISEG